MKHYIEQIPGITDKLNDEELNELTEKAINGVSIWSDQPNVKLLTPHETHKMFELMSNQQLDPNDLNSGYESLSVYMNEQQ